MTEPRDIARELECGMEWIDSVLLRDAAAEIRELHRRINVLQRGICALIVSAGGEITVTREVADSVSLDDILTEKYNIQTEATTYRVRNLKGSHHD